MPENEAMMRLLPAIITGGRDEVKDREIERMEGKERDNSLTRPEGAAPSLPFLRPLTHRKQRSPKQQQKGHKSEVTTVVALTF